MFLSSHLHAPYNYFCTITPVRWVRLIHSSVPHSPTCSCLPSCGPFATPGCGWEGTEQRLLLSRTNCHLFPLNNSSLMLCFAGYGERLSLPVPPWLLWHSLWAQRSDVYRFPVLQRWHVLGKGARGQLCLRLPFRLHRVKLWKKSRQVHKQPVCKWWVFL